MNNAQGKRVLHFGECPHDKDLEELQDTIDHQANLIDSQANRIREQQDHIDALFKLLDVYRTVHQEQGCNDTSDICRITKAENEYDETIKR